jgi:SAM-dependent methyltransferase
VRDGEGTRLNAAIHGTIGKLTRFKLFDRLALRRAWWSLRRTRPVSVWGVERPGGPIDRWYIERFLEAHRSSVHGKVLEVKEDRYGSGLGAETVVVLDIDPDNPEATIIGDLCDSGTLGKAEYDAIVLTQVMQYVTEPRAVLENLVAALVPGGVALITTPTTSRLSDMPGGPAADRWRFTETGMRQLVDGLDAEAVVEAHGNALVARAFLMGLGAGDLDETVLAYDDPAVPLLVTVALRRPQSLTG